MTVTALKPTRQTSILVVDDEEDAVYSFRRVFEKADCTILEANSGEKALAIARDERPDVILMDVRMPGIGGLDTLRALHRLDPRVPVILMTAYASTHGTIEAMKAGAFDYVQKPFDVEKIRAVIRSAVKVSHDMRQPVSLGGAGAGADQHDQIVGRSESMLEVYKAIGRAAASTSPVLILGENGVGKELVARAIYQHSDRAGMPFHAVRCDLVPPDTLDVELFGQRRGAAHGAPGDRLGKLEICAGGTLFLGGIETLIPAMQSKLLRFLESGEVERVGDPRPARADVRIIAAAAPDLDQRAASGEFRPELQNLLGAIVLQLPPLRERGGDLRLLAEHLLARHAPALGLHDVRLDPAAMAALEAHPFPGNVRELESILRSALLQVRGAIVMEQDLELGAPHAGRDALGLPPLADETVFDMLFDEIARRQPLPPGFDAFDVVERKLIIRSLDHCGGNQSRASRFLGITRNTLRKRIQKYGLARTSAGDEEADDGNEP